ncbi:MAG: D-alanyl-D-alanine carboxypeptidase family protein [Eubacteriales bacterium]
MKKNIKNIIRITAVLFALLITMTFMLQVYAYEFNFDAKSVLLMEATTGRVLYENNADEKLPPASVTKIMTMLLVMESIDEGIFKLDDMVRISENAASMGGSQVFLAPGEDMTLEDLLKCVVVASANDASVALAEYIAGSEESFVERMNERAAQLGMVNTFFENTNGLDDTTQNHLTTARDIALMSAELLHHPKILEYSSIWMDSIRNGAFTLTNTNRLIRFYSGANGLKTGSTSKAKFCISATAMRNGMQLIAVIMSAPTRDTRNEIAKKLLDYGFANYMYVNKEAGTAGNIRVVGGVKPDCVTEYGIFNAVLERGADKEIEAKINLDENISAPVTRGDVVGTIEYMKDGVKIGEVEITAAEDIGRIGFFGLFGKLFLKYLMI